MSDKKDNVEKELQRQRHNSAVERRARRKELQEVYIQVDKSDITPPEDKPKKKHGRYNTI